MNKYTWGHSKRYNDYSSYCKRVFSERVQKISIDAGFTCPNRDGTKAAGGCTYCDNNTFNPFYCQPDKPILQQLNEGIDFFAEKYKSQKYLAYFQAYSNTYAPLEKLKSIYAEALEHPKVIGLVIATRPDCVDEEKLDYIEQLAEKHYVVVEYGVESCRNETLAFVNRCHTFEDSVRAIEMTAKRNIHTGVHMILGLPGEDRTIILKHAEILSQLPVKTLKLHQLQIIKGTAMAEQFAANPGLFNTFSSGEYIELVVDFLEKLNPEIIVERFISEAPPVLLISPQWGGLKNYEIIAKIEKRLAERDTWQGRLFIDDIRI